MERRQRGISGPGRGRRAGSGARQEVRSEHESGLAGGGHELRGWRGLTAEGVSSAGVDPSVGGTGLRRAKEPGGPPTELRTVLVRGPGGGPSRQGHFRGKKHPFWPPASSASPCSMMNCMVPRAPCDSLRPQPGALASPPR